MPSIQLEDWAINEVAVHRKGRVPLTDREETYSLCMSNLIPGTRSGDGQLLLLSPGGLQALPEGCRQVF